MRWMRSLQIGILSLLLFLSLSGLPSFARDVLQLQLLDQESQTLPQPEPPVPSAPTAPGLRDSQGFTNFVNQFFEQELSNSHVPGAVISVVKDGKLFFAKGYGYANVEQQIPVEADKTLFRVASLSKLITATAAMQLYEQGKLNLDGDVNQYLRSFQLQNPFSEPVKVAQLMTHTDGTTKRLIGIAAPTAAEMEPLGDYLAEQMPPIVYPPGKLYSYSSHSTALLGYLVEQIAGMPFVQYVDRNIFQPLGMNRSTFLQPLPPSLANNLAIGYQYQSSKYQQVPFLYLNIAPAAAMSTTATDMANFMIAHLQLGRYQNSDILQPQTAQLMHKQHFTFHPLTPGTGYSFRERIENNLRAIGHLGSLRGYSSSMTLLPDRNIGIFIASNSFSGIHGKFLSQFFDRYFPAPQELATKPIALQASDLDRFTGTYWDLEYPRHTFLKLAGTFKHINIVKSNDGNNLVVKTPGLFFMGNPDRIELLPVDLPVFQRATDDAFVVFSEDSGSKAEFVYNPIYPKIGAYRRVPWYETVWVQMGVLIFCVLVFLSASFVYPILPLFRRLRGHSFKVQRSLYWAWIIAGLVGTLNLVFLIGLPLSLWLMGVWKLAYGVPAFAIAFFCLPIITTALTLGLLAFTVLSWQKSYWSLGQRSHYALITFASLVFTPFLLDWNLLGFQF